MAYTTSAAAIATQQLQTRLRYRREHQTYEHHRRHNAPPPADTSPGVLNFPNKGTPMKRIYAIIDTKADALIGGLQLHAHEAAAVRTFGDVAADPQTMLARHPDDFELVCLGKLNDDHTITAMEQHLVIITGAAWKAAQSREDPK